MFGRESSQPDPQTTAALVLRTIEQIDTRSPEDGDELLADLLSAAWGTICSQNQ